MSVIDMSNKFQKKKQQNQVVTHIARADLVSMAVLYFIHVNPNAEKARSLLHAWSTQVMDTAAIQLTQPQYEAFKEASTQTVTTIEKSYDSYIKEADKLA